ncbi:hypothetical protein NFI96_008187 [Prochilodus magdalenae]|nr:hypothetical protein NFI96_008187 [Prochilodus magdalenae]
MMDISVVSGVLTEVHLPRFACLSEGLQVGNLGHFQTSLEVELLKHFMCTGSSPSLKDVVRVLDVQDSGMFLETFGLTCFHAKLLQPSFSPKGFLVGTGFPVKLHCEVLIYQSLIAQLTLHLYLMMTHDCAAMHSSNHIIKFADDTTVVGLMSKNDESAYREEVQRLTDWCRTNNLSLNVDKTKEMVVDFRRTRRDHSPLHIDGSTVEIVKSTKFLGVHLAEDLTWSLNTSTITKKAQQRLYFLRRLRKAHLPPPILTTFYRGTIKSILSSCITAWFGNCTASDRKSLQRIVRTAEKIIGVSLPTIMDIYTTHCIRKTTSIVDDHTHPSHTLFTLLPSEKSLFYTLAGGGGLYAHCRHPSSLARSGPDQKGCNFSC